MPSEPWRFAALIAYFVIYLLLGFAGLWWTRRQRKTRWPFKESDKLLRSPGEGLRKQIAAIDENIPLELLGFIGGSAIALPAFTLIVKLASLNARTAIVGVACGMLVFAVVSAFRITRIWKRRSKLLLGWYGERMTADYLRPLQHRGYHVFHDLPAEPGANGFNIDHVVVGLTGVSIVEVKSRRKGNARPGYTDHEVSFNGTHLDWPWGTDRQSIQQALNEKDWLSNWLFERTGQRIPVKAFLALPGWYVHETPSPNLRVVNPKILPDAIPSRNGQTLTAEQVDLIARQLDQRCRDVED